MSLSLRASRLLVLAIFVTLAVVDTRKGTAATLVPVTNSEATVCLGSPSPGCSIANVGQSVNSGLAQINNTYGSVADHALFTVASAADATFGVLKASANGSYDISGSPITAYTSGRAGFIDVITISYAPWDGLPGLLNIAYTLNGTISSGGNGNAVAFVYTFVGPTLGQSYSQRYTSSTSGTFSEPNAFQFVYGQPFGLQFGILAFAGTFLIPDQTGQGSGSAQFFNTLVLTGLTPTDLNGSQALGAQFSSVSGTQYSTNGVVPEPTTTVLFLMGITALIAKHRSRFRSRGTSDDTAP